MFDMLVGAHDGWSEYKPPFDYMRVFKETGSEEGITAEYLPFDQARFELRPASWVPAG